MGERLLNLLDALRASTGDEGAGWLLAGSIILSGLGGLAGGRLWRGRPSEAPVELHIEGNENTVNFHGGA